MLNQLNTQYRLIQVRAFLLFPEKLKFSKQTEKQLLNEIPVDELLAIANEALEEAGLKLWLLFDRLDVAFVDSSDLERNALRALFRAYNDLKAHGNVALKIFVRDDIWKRITEGGFTEASHITKAVHISWSSDSLLNLIVLRLLNNASFSEYLGVDTEAVKSDFSAQDELFYSIAPRQIDTGKNPDTFDWIVSRTTDASGASVPREVIHLFEVARELQIKKLERGEEEPEDNALFDRASFKDALPQVSKVRYEQTLLAEHPDVAKYLKRLEGEKAEHTVETLAKIWGVTIDKAAVICRRLVDIGFFEERGSKETPSYWVPFLYRGALHLVQGKA